ncbi:MAG: thioredoxin-like domain-containing protein [Planctomycetota bacterium]
MTRIVCPTVLFLVAMFGYASGDDTRIWKDSTGKFSVEAELVSVQDGKVVLKSTAGKEIKISIERLSDEDKLFVQNSQGDLDADTSNPATNDTSTDSKTALKAKPSSKVPSTETVNLKELATRFYDDLRTKDRTIARSMLTDSSQRLAEENKSALEYLPSPDAGKSALRVGKPKISAEQAMVPVIVRIDGEAQNTSLLLHKVEDQWRVFAISAKTDGVENTINFEATVNVDKKSESPLAKLRNQPISISGITLEGIPVSLEQYKGKVVLIDFWATWCGPCRAEIPNLLANYQKYRSAGFEVIAISVDEDLKELASFVKQETPPWVVLADKHPNNKESMGNKFGISSIPTVILVGPDGKVLDIDCRGPKLGQRLSEIFGG